MDDDFRKAALDYHRLPQPGKLAIEPTKRMATQLDLSLAYSPGVAAACEAIVADPDTARDYTTRGNLVGVISNGTAVLGLGNIGALAGKPVMEGKAVLFKKFAGIDVFDIEVDAEDPRRFCDVVAALEPTFGAINLEDIKAPECFAIEAELRRRMRIPVFHDDQHGTAITVAAAVRNGLVLQGKALADVRLVTSGAGAAALACVDLLVSMGLRSENVTLTDIAGVIRTDREGMLPNMARYARDTDARALRDVLGGADVFLGLSAPRVLKPEWLELLAPKPLILALANPEPEILPEQIAALRPDAIVATGRSDFPNQVNNVLCFPFIFRGALDVSATTINEAMKIAAAEAIASLARMEASEVVVAAYGGSAPVFGPDYIIPKPFDPRLILEIAPAVARAAMESGVARRPIHDLAQYQRDLERFVFRSGQLMQPVFEAARQVPRRIVYGEGEDERVLRAAQILVDGGIARPILLGRRSVIERKVRDMGLRIDLADGVRVLDPAQDDDVFGPLLSDYQRLVGRRGIPPEDAAYGLTRAQHGRGGDAAARRARRCGDLRRQRQLVAAGALRAADHSAPAGRQPRLRSRLPDPAARHVVHLRRSDGGRSDRRADRRDDGAGGGGRRRIRYRAEGGPALAFQFRSERFEVGPQDAPRPGAAARACAGVGGGRRDARRCRARGCDPKSGGAGQPPFRHGEPAGDADAGCGAHRVHIAEGGLGWTAGRTDAAGNVEADPRAGAECHRARDCQSERVRGAGGFGRVGVAWH